MQQDTPYIPTPENTWCASPWTEIHIDQGGEMVFCCQAKHVVGNVKENPIKEIFNGREYKKARLETLSNIWPKGCHLCEKAEKVVNRSMRYQQQETYEANLDPIQPDITKDYKIQKFKIDFSNACNLVWSLQCGCLTKQSSYNFLYSKNHSIRQDRASSAIY